MKKKIAIWGAGAFGQYICEQLKKNQDVEIHYIIDKKEEMAGKRIAGIKVISSKQVEEYKDNIDVILVSFMDSFVEYDYFSKYKGVKFGFVANNVFVQKFVLDKDLDADENIIWINDCSKPLLRNLETNVVDYCNLNCKGCSHFSNLYQKGEMVSFENYCKDLKQIAEHVNVRKLNLLGGETLLNNRMTEYIEFARQHMPYTDIWVITNGLLLLKQNEVFFKCCKDNKIGIDISEYEPTSKIINEIIIVLERHGVKYNIRDNKGDFGKNIDLLGRANPNEAMKRCRENACHFFRNGKIYKCPFEVLGNKFFEHFGLDIRLVGGTNIYDKQLDWDKLVHQLENEPVSACVYCGEEERYTWGVSNNPVMEEWIVN